MRVLIVEDDRVCREYLVEMFTRKYQCKATAVASGLEAYDLLVKEAYDMVFLDYLYDNYEITGLQWASVFATKFNVFIVGISGTLSIRQKFLEAGAHLFIPKPPETGDIWFALEMAAKFHHYE